jgi:hypothetical protein
MKMSTQLTLFFLAFNALAGVLIGTGVAADLGINAATGDPQAFDQLAAEDQVRMGNSVGGTLFGMYNVLTQQIATIFYAIAPGFRMLRNFVPTIWVDGFLSPIASVIVTKDIIAFARGVDL